MLDLFGCCRLCLKHDETVTVNSVDIIELRKAVEEIFGFKITLSDKCSTKFCRDCVHKVTSFAMYRDTVLSNQKSLEQYIILNAKLTNNIEVKDDDDNDVILLESNDEKSLGPPKIFDNKKIKINSSEDDLPLMRLIGDQKKLSRINTNTEKNQMDVDQKKPSRINTNPEKNQMDVDQKKPARINTNTEKNQMDVDQKKPSRINTNPGKNQTDVDQKKPSRINTNTEKNQMDGDQKKPSRINTNTDKNQMDGDQKKPSRINTNTEKNQTDVDQKKPARINTNPEKNQMDVRAKNHKTTSRSDFARKRTVSNYLGLSSKHFKNSVVKIRRLSEADLRRLSKSYNQLKIQEEENNTKQSELVTQFIEASSPNLINSKINNQGEDGTIVAKLLSAVSNPENTQSRSIVINRNIVRTKSMEEMKILKHSPVRLVQIPTHYKIAQNQPQIQSDNNNLLARCTTEQAEVNSNLNTQLVKRPRVSSATDPTNKEIQNSVNDSNAKVSNNEICNTEQNQTAPNETFKAIEPSKDARAGHRNFIGPVNKIFRRIIQKLPSTATSDNKLPSTATSDNNKPTIQSDNKQSANTISHILPSSITNDKNSKEIETIDLTDPTLANNKANSNSSSNQHSISQLNVNQSTNNSLELRERTPYQMNYMSDHTYNIVRPPVQQYIISPLHQYSNYRMPQISNIESNERTKPVQLPTQPKPTNSAQISIIPNKTATIINTQIENNPVITPHNLQDRQTSVPKFSNIQFKEIKPKPPNSAQVSTVPNKTEVTHAQSVSVSKSTHLPQNQDRRVKVLTVSELNMRAAEYSQYETVKRKLPIRITLVKIQNEVQIKLTDSNNKEINFYDLTSAEQLAVKSSLIEPSCKKQILSAIKNCSPDQYSANMLRCVGFTLKEVS